MITANFILSKLPEIKNVSDIVVSEQNVSDIKTGMLQEYEKDKADYDLIYKYFVRNTAIKTLENVYNFLKRNVRNVTESEKFQTLRTPAVLLSTGLSLGADCKNYSLFIAGIIGAINRAKVFDIPFSFRFADYVEEDSVSHHVFIVAYPDGEEIWIDAIDDVPYFDYRKEPDSFTDKKVYPMLVAMSGMKKIGSPITADTVYSAATAIDPLNSSASAALNTGADIATGDWINAAVNAYSLVQGLLFSKPDWQVWRDALAKVSPDIAALTYLVYAATLPVNTGGNGDSQIARYSQFNELFGFLGGNDKTAQLSANIVAAWNAQVMLARAHGMPVDQNSLIDPAKASTYNSPYIMNGEITKEGLVQVSKTGLVNPAIIQKLYTTAPSSAVTINPATGQPVAASSGNGLLYVALAAGAAKLAHLF